ncbi:FliM/FliN family flagellar motor switch protein [Croceibacterium ferulae]|uniref:FliM/FliN family flagellar motor switch protein n=1 Tax=Croceibacterium ferulae TaxID=1854641 RepID=UPI000EAC91F0|nr:FliM/FliN family flagellar motor switch protein [Croceibacterium ferulae]
MMQFEPLRAAARAATHAAILCRPAPVKPAPLPRLQAQHGKLARRLAEKLAGVLAVDEPQVRATGIEEIAAGDLGNIISPLAANALWSVVGTPHRLLISVEGKAVLAELDRAFGGTGEIDGPLPAALPLSADRLADRLENAVAQAIGDTLGCLLASAARDTSLAVLHPFAEDRPLVVIGCELGRPWKQAATLAIAVPVDALADLLAGDDGQAPRAARQPASPLDQPFADLPLGLSATLVDMHVPISRLAALTPGTVLPVGIARAVPLSIEGTVIARGTVGELDDQVAVQISHAFRA